MHFQMDHHQSHIAPFCGNSSVWSTERNGYYRTLNSSPLHTELYTMFVGRETEEHWVRGSKWTVLSFYYALVIPCLRHAPSAAQSAYGNGRHVTESCNCSQHDNPVHHSSSESWKTRDI